MLKIYVSLILVLIFTTVFAQNGQLSAGARVLFENTVSRLNYIEKNDFFKSMRLNLNPDNTFSFSKDVKRRVHVTPLDLNNDGEEEELITTEYMDEDKTTVQALVKKSSYSDDFRGVTEEINGELPYIFKNSSSEFPDLVFPDKSGNQLVYKWSDQSYSYEKDSSGEKYNLDDGKPIAKASEEYASYLIKNGLQQKGNSSSETANLDNGSSTISNTLITSSNPEINQLADCQRLVNTGKTQAEKDELQKDYWTLLGIISDLSNYRQMFLQNGKLIDLFPTAYYHTTYAEMQNILKLQFTYPIETMKQIISFYDAYKFNRNLWDNGMKNNVEPHWRDHFEYAERAATDLNVACSRIGFVLSTAIAAHVQCDLPRALKYSYDNRFDKLILSSNTKYSSDYAKANELFASTKYETVEDISNARHCSQSYLVFMLDVKDGAVPDIINQAYEEYNTLCNDLGFKKILTDADVINLRQEAWRKAFAGKPFTDINGAVLLGQPITDHNPLIAIGKNLCPPTPTPDKQAFKILPEWVTHPTDKEFKWYGWDEAPEDLKIATGYLNEYTNVQTKKIVTVLDDINNVIKEGCSVRIAAIDLDNNGIAGIAVYSEGTYCCGYTGTCSFDLSENAGARYGVYIERTGGPSPQEYAGYIMQSGKEIILHQVNKETTSLFDYDTTGLNLKPAKPKTVGNLVGGSTPTELGKILFRALKTNDKKLWVSCIHPIPAEEFPQNKEQLSKTFDDFRNKLIEDGVEDWNLLTYSITTFSTDPMYGEHPKEYKGEKTAYNLNVQFYYKGKEFIGSFQINILLTYNRQNYFMYKLAFGKIGLVRNVFK